VGDERSAGDFSVEEQQILYIVHQTAAEIMAANHEEVIGYRQAADLADTDSLTDRYGLSSLDTLRCLLALEEKFGITLPDEDLSEDVLSSATGLARHIGRLLRAQAHA
jgi:acyl carrier protein